MPKQLPAEDMNNLSKTDLEELKLKTEIIKLRSEIQEKNKPWAIRNLAILIPSLIGFGTILTGIFTGYFNVEAKRLEIQKHDLVQDVQAFTEKKDSLNKKNIELEQSQAILAKQTQRLKSDSSKLIDTILSLAKRTNILDKIKDTLNVQISKINTEKKNLLSEKEKLSKEVKQAAFKEYLTGLLKDAHYYTGNYTGLLNVLKKKMNSGINIYLLLHT